MSSEVTFCLISCGELTEGECLAAIKPHRHEMVFQEVRNTYPQIAALRKMVEQVETPYLVPLDADMILYHDGFARIRRAIDKYHHDPSWHTILFPLYDTLTKRKILALKVLRTSILKQIPFEESATPDVLHYKRLTEAGYVSINKYLDKPPVGDHVVRGKHFCYHKYKDVYQTLRVHGWEWDSGVFMGGTSLEDKARHHYNFFLTQYILTNNKDYLYCIAGMADGLTAPLENRSKSLQKEPYRISTKYPIAEFTRWYLERQLQIMNSVMY